jgi:dihydrolipoamide dehydrogenase
MIVILGGGPAGKSAALHLARAGREVRLIESSGIGGQCLHYGCMMVCGLNDVARTLRSSRDLFELGMVGTPLELDFSRLLREMRKVQDKIEGVLDKETADAGVEVAFGREGRLNGRRVFLGNEELEAEAVIAATGSRPALPEVDGITDRGVYTAHTLHTMKDLPEKLVILGGGIMAAEFAHIFRCFGSKVEILSRSGFLKDMDPHLRALAMKELEEIEIRERVQLSLINSDSRGISLETRTRDGHPQTFDADALFVAAGLVPRSESLEGVTKGRIGEVVVNDRMETNIPGVYACGDVTGPPCLTPIARHEGLVAAENILGRSATMDYRFFPQYMSLVNEFGFCSIESDSDVSLSVPGPAGPGSFWSVPKSNTGLTKISFEPESGRITGIFTAAPAGGIITSYVAYLMQQGYSVYDFERFREVHPAADGVYWLMKYASAWLREQKAAKKI